MNYSLKNTEYKKLYFSDSALKENINKENEGIKLSKNKNIILDYKFEKDTVITGKLKAVLFVESKHNEDYDLFVEIEKLDKEGNKVNFPIFGSDDGEFSFGMLRASQRELDKELSNEVSPEYTFNNPQKIEKGKVVKLEIALSPTSVSLKSGESLKLIVSQKDINSKKAQHKDLINEKDLIIKSNNNQNSYIQIPIIK